jgi:hypothetical protein
MLIVVARYNESIDWTKSYNCIIYNKGDPIENTNTTTIPLPNVGREGHTYLHHIINHYDNLSDYTMFLQGNPFDHTPLESILSSSEWKKPFHVMSRDIVHMDVDKHNPYNMLHLNLI